MNDLNPQNALLTRPQRMFVHQTGLPVYAGPSSNTEVVVRLDEGAPFDILPPDSEAGANWFAIQTRTRQHGYIKATTKMATQGQLELERQALLRSRRWGSSQLIIGGVICLAGAVATVASLMMASKAMGHTVFIFYGAVAAGGGQFWWGFEQLANARRALKKFDELWQEALQSPE